MIRVADTGYAGTGPGSFPRLLPLRHSLIEGEPGRVNRGLRLAPESGNFPTGFDYKELQKVFDALPDTHCTEERQQFPSALLADKPGGL